MIGKRLIVQLTSMDFKLYAGKGHLHVRAKLVTLLKLLVIKKKDKKTRTRLATPVTPLATYYRAVLTFGRF